MREGSLLFLFLRQAGGGGEGHRRLILPQVHYHLLHPQVQTKETVPPIGAVESGQEPGRGEPGQTEWTLKDWDKSDQFWGLLVLSWRPIISFWHGEACEMVKGLSLD